MPKRGTPQQSVLDALGEHAHVHQWHRTGVGAGSEEGVVLWGPPQCWCGAYLQEEGYA